MLRVLPPTFKPVSQQISLSQVARILTSDWIKIRGSHAIHRSYFSCCKTSLPWASKTRNMYIFSFKKENFSVLYATTFRNCNNLICCKTGLIHGWQNALYRYSTTLAALLQNKLHVSVARFLTYLNT